MKTRELIEQFAKSIDVDELIRTYDVDFDIPMRREYALGLLRMRGAFEPAAKDELKVSRRVGAHWCAIIHSDMAYDHWSALRLIEASQEDAEWLHERLSPGSDQRLAYATARWFDAREYARGRSSLLHNLALAYKEGSQDSSRVDVAEARARSIAASTESMAISEALGDEFRISQSLTNLALADPSRSRELFEKVLTLDYPRGRQIATERLAVLEESPKQAAVKLRDLLDQLLGGAGTGGIGTEVHLSAFAVELYDAAVKRLGADDGGFDFAADVRGKRFAVAESVRRAVAMPAYKQAYARAVRPSFLERIARRPAAAVPVGQRHRVHRAGPQSAPDTAGRPR